MSDSTSHHLTWDSSADVLQGIMGTRVTSLPSHLDVQSDGMTMSSDLALGDPASFLGIQFDSEPGVLPHNHASILNQWPPYHNQPTSPSHHFDYPQYPHARFTNNQDAWNPLQVTGVPANPPAFPTRRMSESQQASVYDRRYSTGQHSTLSENESHYNGIHPSDSGYGTHSCTTRSVTTSSYALEPTCSPFLGPHESEPEDKIASWDLNVPQYNETSIDIRDGTGSPSFICHDVIKCDYPGCPWTGKCPSDKRKHEARHRKLFKCDEPHCTRKEGFGTINDLARHKKCVHKQEPERGPKILYMCFGHDCPRKDKKWPRLDNFRQHLTRMHNDEDTEELLKKSQDWYDTCVKPQEMSPSVVERFSEMVSALKAREGLNPGIAAAEITLDDTGSVVPAPPFGPSTPQGDQGFRTNHGLDYNRTSRRSTSTESLTDFSTGKTTQMDPKPEEAASMSTQRGNPNEKMEDMIAEAAVNMINAMTKIMNSNQRRRSQQAEDVDEMIAPSAELSDRKREVLQKILSAALDQLSGTSDNTQASPHTTLDGEPDKKGWIQCEFCTKQTRLRCEMKKHKKRHERPYGCTFHKCNKTFGSKADWKRHENSQHFHLQSWRCTLQDATQSGLQCARLFYRQEVYVQHLKRYHHAGEEEVRAAICKNRIGRNGQSQFWCGFCRNIVPLKSQGLAAWNERFNHIDMEHFKKGERIGDWLLPSGHLTKDREREEEKARAMTDTNEGDSEPAVEDNSDDDSESSIYHSDSDGLQDEVAVVKQQHIPRFPFQQFEDCLPDRSSSITLYPSTGPTNLRKRKISTPQPALELYYDVGDQSLNIEKRSKTRISPCSGQP